MHAAREDPAWNGSSRALVSKRGSGISVSCVYVFASGLHWHIMKYDFLTVITNDM